MARLETRYARSGDVHIAYQVVGEGAVDIVFVQGFISNLEVQWEEPGLAHLLTRLAALGRLILFDKRGAGLSDRVPDMPSLETRMEDVRAVMDAAGSRRAVLIGASEGGPMSILFAATHPERTAALILYGAYAHFRSWVLSREAVEKFVAGVDASWGGGESLRAFAPGLLGDARFRAWWARFERLGTSPAGAMALARINAEIDVRPVLPSVRVPTLVLHRRGDVRVDAEAGRYLARHIRGARHVELEGSDHPMWVGDTDAIVDEIEDFLTGARPAPADHRVLATVLATEIADARHLAARLAAIVAEQAVRFGGRVAAPGIALFDGPSRAVRCAMAIRNEAGSIGLAVSAGVHTGEVERRGEAAGGRALQVAAGMAAAARPGDVLVSAMVRDLASDGGLVFSERGACALAGLSEPVRLLVASLRDDPAEAARSGRADLAALSPREREIVGFLARGMTNGGIATELALSEHTVKRHVANILLKLDLPTRSAAAALVAGQR